MASRAGRPRAVDKGGPVASAILIVLPTVELLECFLRGVELPTRLADRRSPRVPIDREHGPALSFLAAEVHEDRVAIVLHAHPMGRIALLVK